MNDILATGGQAGLVLALTQLLKSYVADRFHPLLSLGLGIVIGLLFGGLTLQAALDGLVAGLAAAGLYDQKRIVK